jgi:hypothetical protein
MFQKEVEILVLFDQYRHSQESGFQPFKIPNRFSFQPAFPFYRLPDDLAPDHMFESPAEKFPLPENLRGLPFILLGTPTYLPTLRK